MLYHVFMMHSFNLPRVLWSSLYAGLFSLPVTGFFAGTILCSDCNTTFLGQTVGRAFIGFVYSVLNTIQLGRPMKDGGSADPYNLLPYTLVVWVVLTFIIYIWISKSAAKRADYVSHDH
jgi:hypothetical protein